MIHWLQHLYAPLKVLIGIGVTIVLLAIIFVIRFVLDEW